MYWLASLTNIATENPKNLKMFTFYQKYTIVLLKSQKIQGVLLK